MTNRNTFLSLATLALVSLVAAPSARADDYFWLNRTSTPTSNDLRQVSVVNGSLVATGIKGTLLTSADGSAWTSQPMPTTETLSAVAFGNGRYLAANMRDGLFTSTDAAHWATAVPDSGNSWDTIVALAFGNGVFVRARSASGVWSSTDGQTWEKARSDSGDEVSATSSPWSSDTGPRFLKFVDGKFYLLANARVWSSTDGRFWTSTSIARAAYLTEFAAGNGHFVIARGDAGITYTIGGENFLGGGFFRSDDGVTWTSHTSPELSEVNFVDGFFYAREAKTDALLRSADGQSWTTHSATVPATSLLGAIQFNARYYALNSGDLSQLHTSADGATWTSLHATQSLTAADGVAYGNGVYVAGGLISTDGITWTPGAFAGEGKGNLRPVFCHDRFFFFENRPPGPEAGALGFAAVYMSLDGRTGVKIFSTTVGGADRGGSAAYGNGRYVVSSPMALLTSTDGSSWTSTATDAGQVAFGAGQFVAVKNAALYSSPDGATWTLRYTAPPRENGYPFYGISGVAFGGSRFVAFQVVTGKVYETSGCSALVSTDGLTWQSTDSLGVNFPSTPAYVDGLWLAHASGHTSATASQDFLLLSLDGTSWQSRPMNARGLTAFAGTNGLIVGSNNADLFSTTLGSTAPAITSTSVGPTSLKRGQTTLFSVAVSGSVPVSYQWRRNGVPIAGATLTFYQPPPSADTAGNYDVVVTNPAGQVVSAAIPVVLDDAWLANVSSRAQVGTGEDILIQGFVLRADSGDLSMLARAIGPSLAPLGVHDVLADPSLELYRQGSSAALAHNDNWSDDGQQTAAENLFAQLGAFGLPATSKDAALVTHLASGAYSFPISGALGGTGVALSELYDASPRGRIVNLSARARVGTGDRTLIAGFVVAGGKPLKLLIRAVGPGLASQGVAHPLANPQLTLYRGADAINRNDDWGQAENAAALAATTTATGAFALADGSKDAAMLVALTPGVYSVHVTSVDATSGLPAGGSAQEGVALVELYEAP